MKNLSNIKSALAVSMLLSASLFSMDGCHKDSTLETMEKAVNAERAFGATGYNIDRNEAAFSRQVVMDDRLAESKADVGARHRLLVDAQRRQTMLEEAFGGSKRKATRDCASNYFLELKDGHKKLVEKFGNHASVLQRIALEASKDPKAVSVRSTLNDLDYKIATIEARLSDLDKARDATQEHKKSLRTSSQRQVEELRKLIKASNENPNEIIRAYAFGTKTTKTVKGFKVETQKHPCLNSFIEAVNSEWDKDQGIGDYPNLPTMQKLAAGIVETKEALSKTKAEEKNLGKAIKRYKKELSDNSAKRAAEVDMFTKRRAEETGDRIVKTHNANVLQHVSLTKDRTNKLCPTEVDQKTRTLQFGMAQVIADSKHEGTDILLLQTANEATRNAQIKLRVSEATFERSSRENPNCAFQQARVNLKIAGIHQQISKNKNAAMRSLQEEIAKLESELAQYEVSGKVSHCETPAPKGWLASAVSYLFGK